MIGYLKGKAEFIDGQHIIVNVQGVGYKVLVSSDILGKAEIGKEIRLFTYTYVRDDTLDLFGFLSIEDLKLFEQLIGVSGIGPKTAVGIFSVGDRTAIIEAVVKADVDFFAAVPRLGRKNAQKIIIELKTKLGSLSEIDLSVEGGKETSDILNVLKTFGFSRKEAQEALKAVANDAKTTEEKIRAALKYLGK